MSSTNRTNRYNVKNTCSPDYYVTPISEIVLFLKEFSKIESNINSMNILDSCAGGDNFNPMSYPEAFKKLGFTNKIYTIDIRKDSLADEKIDYFNFKLNNKFDMIISNPPFSLAMDFIQKSLDDVKNDGWVIYLLRLNFLESKNRKLFFEKNMPEYIFVHHKRMSFNNKGSDSIAYAHMCWRKNSNPKFSKLIII